MLGRTKKEYSAPSFTCIDKNGTVVLLWEKQIAGNLPPFGNGVKSRL
jgi:hypothetical protein